MKHYLFEITEDAHEGEQFIVGAENFREACLFAHNVASNVCFMGAMTEEEAEASGLDEY